MELTKRQRWLVIALMCLPVFIGSLDVTIVSAILPEVITELNLSLDNQYDEASWALSGYLLAYTISMTFTGRLSDIVGRRWVYVVCLAIFMFGSWFVTIADGAPAEWYLNAYRRIYPDPDLNIPPTLETRQLYMFIAGRVIQAIGAGAMVPVTMALVSDMFPPAERPRPIGFVGAVDTSGWVLGHLYGGVMVKVFGDYGVDIVNFFANLGLTIDMPDWRWLFLANIPFSFVALVGAWIALRKTDYVPDGSQKFDYIGTTLVTFSLIGLNLGLGSPSPESAVASGEVDSAVGQLPEFAVYFLIGSLISFIAFIFWEQYTDHPLIELSLFKNKNFSVAGFVNLCLGFALAIGLVSIPILINIRLSEPTRDQLLQAAYSAGLVLSGLTVPMALAAVPGGWLTEKFGFRPVTVGGMALAIVGFLIAAITWDENISYWLMASEIAIVGIGLGLTVSPVSTAVINQAKEGQLGISAALVLILRLIGMTVAISSLTNYALTRIDERALDLVEAGNNNPYLVATYDQMNEIYFVGAFVCLIAMLSAFMLSGGSKEDESIAVRH